MLTIRLSSQAMGPKPAMSIIWTEAARYMYWSNQSPLKETVESEVTGSHPFYIIDSYLEITS